MYPLSEQAILANKPLPFLAYHFLDGLLGLPYQNESMYQPSYKLVYLTLPVAVPLMYLAELVLLRRMFFKLKLYKPIVERINLLANGEVIEVVYSNKISRKLKGLPTNEHFWITMLKPAEYTESDIPILHDEFPSSTDAIRPPGPFEYAWIKFYSNCDNHLMIPRRYEFANMEVLVHYAPIQTEVFKGKLI